ncbi:hypothetical protein SDC9_175498 [bioreactor metagenome]|uniref:Uncharacterized protein n=1 Tax=bioreactor metagenome TaxID=1076179 RepID=A0A645GQ81_9ZZZZ
MRLSQITLLTNVVIKRIALKKVCSIAAPTLFVIFNNAVNQNSAKVIKRRSKPLNPLAEVIDVFFKLVNLGSGLLNLETLDLNLPIKNTNGRFQSACLTLGFLNIIFPTGSFLSETACVLCFIVLFTFALVGSCAILRRQKMAREAKQK